MRKSADALTQWLALTWERPERSYNPPLRDFFVEVLGYSKNRVITEDKAALGYPDIKLLTTEGTAWVVGDLKKDDNELLLPARRALLWNEKRKYIDGLTRYVLFLTAHFLWILTPDGLPVTGFDAPLDLRTLTFGELQARLRFLHADSATHTRQWLEFVNGDLPYVYLTLDNPETLDQLRYDLRTGFQELQTAATQTMQTLEADYREYQRRRKEIDQNLVGNLDTQRRARVRIELEYGFVRRLFEESISQFEEQYGRDVQAAKLLHEAFIADSAAALIARVLFLRLVEDLGMQPRRLSNGGPKNWAAFLSELTGDARALVRHISDNMERVYKEPFAPTVFDWIQRANEQLDIALQRLIIRLNAYDFSGLSEEILGDIYQQFLPLQKRKQLGEFYTPPSVVEWILDATVRTHGLGTLLDPSCGSGSFLVRYAHWRLEDARARGLDTAQVSRELQAEAWGFDINPFASFISHFQMLWALLRFAPNEASPHIEVHNLNSLLSDVNIEPFVGTEHLPPGSKARDSKKWKYVVGNPPYIRAERVKYGGEMREFWAHIWGQNADTGLVVLYRALTEWLEPGGFLGMVVSGGYANSTTAGKVWQLLHPGQKAALRKIVWLEFVGKLWDATVIPMLLIIERVEAKEDDVIEISVPQSWADSGNAPATLAINYGDFFAPAINPRVTNEVAPYGDYLLPLLEPDDIPLLRKLYPNGNGSPFQPLGNVVKWTYGIQRGGVEVTEEPTGTNPIQVIAGRSLAMAWGGAAAGWIDLDAVKARPFGKLSLWRNGTPPQKYLAVAKIGLVPFAAIMVSEQGEQASLDTLTIGEQSVGSLEAVAAFLNSKLARYYWAIRLRTGVLEGSSRATIYPRALAGLPWLKTMTPETEKSLADGYDRLAALAQIAKNNPNEWLLTETERRLEAGHFRITEPSLGLRFTAGITEILRDELQWEGIRIAPIAEFANAEVAEYVATLLTLTTEEETLIKAVEIQKLLIPRDYAALMSEYHQRLEAFRQVEQEFMRILAEVDTAVGNAFGLTPEEQTYIAQRLNRFPLNRLQPRYPWQAVRPRAIKSYMVDRFA